jgi:hypothetical protein
MCLQVGPTSLFYKSYLINFYFQNLKLTVFFFSMMSDFSAMETILEIIFIILDFQ